MIRITWAIFSFIPSLVFAQAGTDWVSDAYYYNKNKYDLSNLTVGQETLIFSETNDLFIWDNTPSNIRNRNFNCSYSSRSIASDGLIDSGNPDYKFKLYVSGSLVKKCNYSDGYVTQDPTSGREHHWYLLFEMKLRKVGNTGSDAILRFPKFQFCTNTGSSSCSGQDSLPYNDTRRNYYEPNNSTSNVIVPSLACGAVLKDENNQDSNGTFSLDRIAKWLTVGEPPTYGGSSFIVDTDGDEGCKNYTKAQIDFDFQQTISSAGDYVVRSDSVDYGFILRDKNGVNISNSYSKLFSEGTLNPLRFYFNYYLLTGNPHGGIVNSVPINITVEYQ
ncbi:hypothetical protein GCM10007938_26010 [Vibrio zhanjiangensis]|uniref:Fimbrial protein n=1 Tax=Vibrio zhanjiangensis TaxID=1046128 RepID=A0ABQ6EZZ3_9VIBR|nr:hypothetical protein [Vibrio zhanjiangensis]GLT18820.1 hypothetical protein GCM10007938_26010 [Vibrio zhanjiangensis]